MCRPLSVSRLRQKEELPNVERDQCILRGSYSVNDLKEQEFYSQPRAEVAESREERAGSAIVVTAAEGGPVSQAQPRARHSRVHFVWSRIGAGAWMISPSVASAWSNLQPGELKTPSRATISCRYLPRTEKKHGPNIAWFKVHPAGQETACQWCRRRRIAADCL